MCMCVCSVGDQKAHFLQMIGKRACRGIHPRVPAYIRTYIHTTHIVCLVLSVLVNTMSCMRENGS